VRRREAVAATMAPASAASIDRFCDAVWIEEGLAANTLSAYRRDLTLLATWLGAQSGRALDAATETDLRGYALARHAGSAPTSTNRRLTVFKRFFRWAVREHLIGVDPTLKLDAARQPLRVPKTLSEAQVEALLAAPDIDIEAVPSKKRAEARRKRALLDALNEYQGAVILITHDRSLMELVADRLWLAADGTVAPFDGDMDDYARLVLDRAKIAAPSQNRKVKRKRAA